MVVEVRPPIQCRNCGIPGTGKFCAECGADLSAQHASAYLLFADSFLGFTDVKHYLQTYLSILRSPHKSHYPRLRGQHASGRLSLS
jgi:hypothetical protein